MATQKKKCYPKKNKKMATPPKKKWRTLLRTGLLMRFEHYCKRWSQTHAHKLFPDRKLLGSWNKLTNQPRMKQPSQLMPT